MKMAFLVRRDLKMPAGKIAVQVAHAACFCMLNYIGSFPIESSKKVALRVETKEELEAYMDKAKKLNIPYICSTTSFAFNEHTAKLMKKDFREILSMILGMSRINKKIKLLIDNGYDFIFWLNKIAMNIIDNLDNDKLINFCIAVADIEFNSIFLTNYDIQLTAFIILCLKNV